MSDNTSESLGCMEIRRAADGNGAEIVNARSDELLPILQGPIPDKVIGFKRIWIRYVDQTVIEFLQRICRLVDSSGTTVTIHTFYDQSRSWEIIRQQIWPLINDNNICGLRLHSSHLDCLRQFSPAILRNCPNLRSIVCLELFPKFPADDNADASSEQAVAKWLLTPRGDGLPNMLNCGYILDYPRRGMEELKGSFVNASEPVIFIIHLLTFHSGPTEPFELKNNLTGERLTLRLIDELYWLLVRCPIGREEAKWAAWEKEAMWISRHHQWNRIDIIFEDSDIGDDDCQPNLRSFYDFKDVREIGAGGFGTVFYGKEPPSNRNVALKRIKLTKKDTDVVKEVNILKSLNHPNIVKCFYSFEEVTRFSGVKYLVLVLEYVNGGDLETWLKRKTNDHRLLVPEADIWRVFTQIADAVQYIHTKRIIHRDLKPANVLLTTEDTVKLADFGLSRQQKADSFAHTFCGTPYYMSPECILGKPYTTKSDVWSLGCILYEMGTLHSPFFGEKNEISLMQKIRDAKYPPFPDRCCYTEQLELLVQRCLNPVYKERPSASDVYLMAKKMARH